MTHLLEVLAELAAGATNDDDRLLLRGHIERTRYYIDQLERQGWDFTPADAVYRRALDATSPTSAEAR
ncbi:MAG: hypothetical protein AAGA56_31295 [Myxococcota bacterium]